MQKEIGSPMDVTDALASSEVEAVSSIKETMNNDWNMADLIWTTRRGYIIDSFEFNSVVQYCPN